MEILGFSILMVASIFLMRDLKEMRQEHQQEGASLWYRRRRRRIRGQLNWIVYALLILTGTVWWGVCTFLPLSEEFVDDQYAVEVRYCLLCVALCCG